MLNVKQCITNDEVNWIKNLISSNRGIKEIFGNNTDRLASSSIITLVENDDTPIGFIYVAQEFSEDRIGFVDMGIISDKRGYGYGKEALDMFLNKTKNIDMFLIAEIKEKNDIAKRSLNKYEHIYDKDDLSFYLLNRSIKELKEEGLYEELTNHLNSNRISSKDMVKSLY